MSRPGSQRVKLISNVGDGQQFLWGRLKVVLPGGGYRRAVVGQNCGSMEIMAEHFVYSDLGAM